MRLPWTRTKPAPAPAPFVPADGWEAELLDASRDADESAAMLAEALFRRRRAASAVFSLTRSSSRAALGVILSAYATGRGLWRAGYGDRSLGELIAAPHIGATARATFEHMAQAAIEQSRSGRPAPETDLPQPAPADPGSEPERAACA